MSTSSQQAQSMVDAMAEQAMTDGVFGQYDIAKIRISPDNRKRFNEQALQELAESIKSVGVAQAILIRPVDPTPEAPEEFEIVAGERRFRASKIAGKATIPALCRNLSNLDAAKIRILENLQREDPHPMEEAEGYQLLMLQHGFSADQLADEVKKSKAYVYARLKLCALTPELREHFLDNTMPASTALLIARIPVPALQVQAFEEVTKLQYGGEPMSVRAATSHIQQRYMLDLTDAIFKVDDPKLLKAAGACTTCPKRTGNQPDIFKDVSADVCTDPECFAEKKAAHYSVIVVKANKKGITVYEGDEGNGILQSTRSYGSCSSEFVTASTSMWDFQRNAPSTGNCGTPASYLNENDMPPVAAYVKNPRGDLVELYKRVDMQAALETAGACETEEARAERLRQANSEEAPPSGKTEKQKKQEAQEATFRQKAEQATTFRVTLYTRIREHMAKNGLSLQSLREITKLALCGNYSELYLPNELQALYDAHGNDLAAHIDQAELPEVQLLLIDAIVGHTLGVDAYDIKSGNTDEDDFDAVLNIATHEGIDYNQLHAEMFPAPIDVAGLQHADLVDFLKARLNRINEIKDKIVAERPDLISELERAANSLGYFYGANGFQLQESKPAGGEAGTAATNQDDAGLADMAPAAAGSTDDAPAKSTVKKSKKKVSTATQQGAAQ